MKFLTTHFKTPNWKYFALNKDYFMSWCIDSV